MGGEDRWSIWVVVEPRLSSLTSSHRYSIASFVVAVVVVVVEEGVAAAMAMITAVWEEDGRWNGFMKIFSVRSLL